jgi:hypothetical protein
MRNISIIFLVFLFLLSCHEQTKRYKSDIITINGLEFTDELSITLDKKTGDTIKIEGIPKDPALINGIPCSGDITFTGNWQLYEFTLADEHSFEGHTFPEGTKVGLNVDIHPYIDNRRCGICRIVNNLDPSMGKC